MQKPFLFVGLDYTNAHEAAEFAEELAQVDRDNFGYKLNLDFFINCALLGDTKPLARVLRLDKPVFVDLKMWNGRRTMTSIVETLGITGCGSYVDVHALADRPFLKAVVDEASPRGIKVLANTVLTHYGDDYAQRLRGCSLKEAVRKDAKIAYEAGCHGITIAGTMLKEVRGFDLIKLVPAVRPDWYGKTGDNFQKQESSVREAIDGGADLLVCSSPIRKSPNRQEALIKTLDEMN